MHECRVRARLLVLVLVPLLQARAGVAAPAGESGPARTLHLADRLAAARIVTPLDGLEPARDVGELESPAVDLLLEEDFEAFEWEYTDWPRVAWASVIGVEGERRLTLSGATDQVSIGWVLPVRSDAFYRFERSVRVRGVPFCDFYVVESRRELEDTRLDSQRLFLAGRGEALKVHGLALDEGRGLDEASTWQRGSTSFYPTPRTRSLVVLLRPRVGMDFGAEVAGMEFDDLRLEEVVPGRRERMRLLKAAHPDPDADPSLGLRKAGWLLPLPTPYAKEDWEPDDVNYTWRRALYAPPTTELAFDLELPPGARLRLATGLARETPLGAAARFRVTWEVSGAEPRVLLDRVRRARMEEWCWVEEAIDLAGRAGERGTLVLRTEAEEGDPHPLWADPRVEPAVGPEDPLVVLIAVDTLRADRLGSYGYGRETTPALDRLATDGVRFDQARSNCNWTCPSFASIFTGLVPSRHGVSSYGPATPLPDELVTLAEHFRREGWETRSIAYKVPLFDGNYEQGFDAAFNVPRDVIRGEENVARALEWLGAHRGGPAFLFLHFNDPHQPFVQPEPYDRSFGPGPEELGLSYPVGVPGAGQEDLQRLFADLYDGAVSYVDACIGRFLEALRERGLYDRATIAFVADHGEQLWERGRFGHGGRELFDEVVRVPLIVKPTAGSCEPGRVVEASVSGFDVMPTLLELAGIEPAGPLDARSLVPLIEGTRAWPERGVVTETSQRGLALVHGGYKLVLEPGGQAESLYHLAEDPREATDVAGERPDVLDRMRERAIAYVLSHRPGCFLLARAEEGERLSVSTSAVRVLAGPGTSVVATGADACEVELAPARWSLLEIEDLEPGAIEVAGVPARNGGFEPWGTGGPERFEGAGVWRFLGPGPRATAVEAAAPEPVDAEMLEALKRLGYAE